MSEDLKEIIKRDLAAHPLDRDPCVLAKALERIEQLEESVFDLNCELREIFDRDDD